jgi:HEPN domain-containing protein
MLYDRPIPGSPKDWLLRARGDLALARAPLPEGAFYEDLCFHCQQAAEKALKAVYQHKGWSFRYTHDLAELIAGLKSQGLKVSTQIDQAVLLTTFAWETRYPGLGEPVTYEEYQESLQHAENVINWAEDTIGCKANN